MAQQLTDVVLKIRGDAAEAQTVVGSWKSADGDETKNGELGPGLSQEATDIYAALVSAAATANPSLTLDKLTVKVSGDGATADKARGFCNCSNPATGAQTSPTVDRTLPDADVTALYAQAITDATTAMNA